MRFTRSWPLAALALASAVAPLDGKSASAAADAAWRQVSQDSATSRCIGDPKTAVCAVETVIACVVRREAQLCRIAAVDPGDGLFERMTAQKLPPQHYGRYKINGVHTVRRDEIPGIFAEFGSHDPDLRMKGIEVLGIAAGDLRVTTAETECWSDMKRQCGPIFALKDYYVRRVDDRWRVVTWRERDAPQ
jgi:hypothetical protein